MEVNAIPKRTFLAILALIDEWFSTARRITPIIVLGIKQFTLWDFFIEVVYCFVFFTTFVA